MNYDNSIKNRFKWNLNNVAPENFCVDKKTFFSLLFLFNVY